MKNTTLVFRTLLNRIYLVPLFVLFSANTFGQYTSIPDSNFELALSAYDDIPGDLQVPTANISGLTQLDVSNKNIGSLIGIKDFTSLTQLLCNDNSITDLDVSGMTNLKYFYCENNAITNLNISGLTNLWELWASDNPFSNPVLDVHGSPDLYYLRCENNGLTSLNISGLTNLDTVILWQNNLTTLDLSSNLNLKYLDCDDNAFASLDVSPFTKLEQFYCSGNLLTTMDVRGLTNLANFECSYNPSLSCILVDDVDAAIVEETAGNWVKDEGAIYSYCNCSLTTTWTSASGGSWDNGAPTDGTYAAIISADYNESANINACSLTINGNAVVTIPANFKVTLNAPINVTAGSSFTLSSDANLIQTNKNSINSGAITVNRTSNPLFRLDHRLQGKIYYLSLQQLP
jgi:hypothetical protein